MNMNEKMSFQKKYDHELSPKEAKAQLLDIMRRESKPHAEYFVNSHYGQTRVFPWLGWFELALFCAISALIPLIILLCCVVYLIMEGALFASEEYSATLIEGLAMIIGLGATFVLTTLYVISTLKKRKKFVKDFFEDEITAECNDRKKAAKWFWRCVIIRGRQDSRMQKYTYDRELYKDYSHLLKWL
jgi:hypothetical protein